MLVTTGISGSLQDFSKCVGMGSRQQDVDLEFTMSIRTSSSAKDIFCSAVSFHSVCIFIFVSVCVSVLPTDNCINKKIC